MKTILVTGGAGFIGSHVVDRLLADNYRVVVIDNFNDFYDPILKRRNIEMHLEHVNYVLYEGDICNVDLLEDIFSKYVISAVIHLAARAGVRPSLEQPVLYQQVNVAGTQNVFECCRKYQVKKCLFASSSSVYGINNKIPFAEEDPIFKPISPYAATKASGELLAHVYSHLYDIQILCLRFFTVYGPRQRPDLAINKFTRLIDTGNPLPFYGDGTTLRDYTYIEDIVAGIMGAFHYSATNYEVVNLGNSNTVSLKELIDVLEDTIGKRAILDKMPLQPGDVPKTYADISKARNLFGFNPSTTINQGIKKYIEWYRESKR